MKVIPVQCPKIFFVILYIFPCILLSDMLAEAIIEEFQQILVFNFCWCTYRYLTSIACADAEKNQYKITITN